MGLDVTDVGMDKGKERRELKKHAATIHCSNTLSLLQRKVSNALLYHAYPELMSKEEHEITVKQLCRLIGYAGNNHAVIREALRGLISTVIEWNLIDNKTGNENWTASSILASVSLEGPMCYFAYSPRMKQLLYSPSMFGKIDLVIQSRFRSSYGLALYENCIRYRGLPNTKWFEIDLFKKLMGVNPGLYDIFRDFKRRVLDKAVDEVNMYSDLTVTPEYLKEGRRVVRVRFSLKDRAKRTRLGDRGRVSAKALESLTGLKQTLTKQFGLSEIQADELMATYPKEYLLDKIAMLQASSSFKRGKVKSKAGYLITAIRQDFKMPDEKPADIISIADARAEMELLELRKRVEGIHDQYQAYREEVIEQVVEALPEPHKATFMEGFLRFADPAISTIIRLQAGKYNRETVMGSPQIRALLRRYAQRELEGISVLTLEEFVSQLDDIQQDAWRRIKSLDPEHVLLKR